MKKKILILLALLMALTLVFVACKDDPVPPEETTVADQPTEEPTQGDEDPTEAPDTNDQTQEPETTDEPDESETPKPEDPTKEPDTPTQEPETQDPMEPVNVFDAEDIQTVTGGDPNNMTQDCLTLEDGYIHVVPLGADPYWYPFASVDGARYVAIRYRTDATGADMQLYISSTGTGPTDDTTMIRQPVVADGEWQLVIFDTQSLIDAGKYDGKYVSYFRFDPLEAGYILDENGEPYKDESGQWARHSLPEGCSIDVAYIAFFHSEEAAKMYDFEQYKAPIWTASGFVTHLSFDELDKYAGETRVEGVFTPGQSSSWDHIITLNDFTVDTLQYYGWVSGTGNLGQFGYQINGGSAIYNDEWTHEADMMAHAPAGSDHARRMQIWISLAGLEGENSIRVLYRNAAGQEACLSEFTVILPVLPKDITDSFASDVNASDVGTKVDASDLSNFFVMGMPTGGCTIDANGEGKLYNMSNINEFFADVNGRYYINANVIDSNAGGWMFVRGNRVVNSDEITEKFDPAGGFFMINNYYETDSAGAMGGAGIYARLAGGKLFIMVKYYNPETITRVGNKTYAIDAVGSQLTMADDGSTVSILVDGVTYATIDISGSVTYDDIKDVQPRNGFAQTAVISLKNGNTETIENTLIADACDCQIGIVARGGFIKFDSLTVGGYSAVEVPELEIVTPEDPEPVDPDAPVLVLTPEFINGQAHSTVITQAQCIGSSEIITEDEITFVRLTANGGDPYVALVDLGSYLELPQYMAFAYRTNSGTDAQIFIGSGSGWSGKGDVTSLAWNEDGNWNSAILDLGNVGLTSITNGIISYCRFDFFTDQGAGGDYLDVEYVAFFNSAEAAEKYFNKLHGIETPDEPEIPANPYDPDATYQNIDIKLGLGAKGSPFSADKKFGHRVNIGDDLLKGLFVQEMATYDDGDVNTFTVKVWQWNSDYATTVATEPLYVFNGENHINCTSLTVGVPVELGIHGDIYYEIEYLTGIAKFTGWTANDGAPEGVETYVGGNLTSGSYLANLIVAKKIEGEMMDTHNFQSNASSFDTSAGNVTITATDLPNAFKIALGQGDVGNAFLDANSLYTMGGFNAVFTAPNGAYAFSFKNLQAPGHVGFTAVFVRGILNAGPEKTYYGADGNDSSANSFGGGGIYFIIKNGKLTINVKTYVEGKMVPYFVETTVDSNDLTIVDSNNVISVVVGDKLVATIVLNGTADYGIANVCAEISASSATVTLADGTVHEITNVIAAADMLNGDLGFATRGSGQMTFEAVSVMPANTVTVPEFPHIHRHEAVVTAPTCTEQGYTTHTCSCGDSYVDSYVDAIGHNFVFGTCTVCGETDPNYVPTPEEIVNAAYGLAEGAALNGTYTLEGVIISIDDAFSSQYNNITVTIVIGNMNDKPIKCYRLKGTGADALKKGDTITVTGILKNYYGTIEFDSGCTLDAVIPGPDVEPEQPDENSISIDFSDKANRTEFTTSLQVWANGDFVLTNNKGASPSNVGDYASPARFYANSDIIFTYTGMVKLVIESDSGKYLTNFTNSLDTAGVTYILDGTTVTIEFEEATDSFSLTLSGGQSRFKKATAYVAPAEEPEEPVANEITVTTTDMYTWVDMIQFTAPVSGVYTFTLPAGLGAWDAIESDTNPYSSSPFIDFNTQQEGGSFSVEIAANDTYSFYIGAFTKADWVITWTVEEKEVVGGGDEPGTEEPEIPSVDFSGTYYHADGYLVIDSIAGTMTHYYDTEYVFDYTFTVTDGVVALSNQFGPINEGMAVYMGKLALGEDGKPVTFWYNGVEYALSTEAPEPIVPDIPVGGNVLNLGPNTVTVTDDIITAGGVEYTFVAEAEGTYTFVSDFFVRITDALGISYNNNSNLTAGTYTVSLGTMFISEAGNYTVNVEFVPAAEDGDDFVAPEDAVEFPYTLTVEGEHDIYFNFAPAEDCVVKITYTAGNFVSGLTDYDRNTEECYYIARFTGKQVYNINPWGSSAGTYTFEYYTEE